VDVADHPRGWEALVAPRDDAERGWVREQEHVRVEDLREALDRGAVELGDSALEGVFIEHVVRDCHVLAATWNVRELQVDEPNTL
jgi:hypothetical protein